MVLTYKATPSLTLGVSGDDALDADGAPLRKRQQFIVLLGTVATF